jgi:hypothetical protein
MLRQEKLMLKNALFRQTLEGRFCMDILRTVLQSALAAKQPLEEYLIHVLTAHPADVENAPESFTPYAVATQRARADSTQAVAA